MEVRVGDQPLEASVGSDIEAKVGGQLVEDVPLSP